MICGGARCNVAFCHYLVPLGESGVGRLGHKLVHLHILHIYQVIGSTITHHCYLVRGNQGVPPTRVSNCIWDPFDALLQSCS